MLFEPTPLAGAFLVRLQRLEDERGSFARSWCREEFRTRGLNPNLSQCNISFNVRKGTLRGLHFQTAPHAEAKLVHCTRGSIYDVIIDLRPDSPTFTHWSATELTPDNDLMVYVPEGFAHGFQTLQDGSEVFYQMSTPYARDSATGVRWDDPAFKINWPLSNPILSDRDRAYPDFRS
jgi:dTDP-4-dehydrorhamnose 3,5-epimerase